MIHYYTHIPLFMYSLTHPSIILILRTGASSGVLYQMLRNKEGYVLDTLGEINCINIYRKVKDYK